LSRRIDQLEGLFDSRLLHRLTRKLAPIAEGLPLLERCARALDQIYEIERHNDGQARSGSVRNVVMHRARCAQWPNMIA
jgi:DNA-binding transcriptional LysR family regulator